MHLETILKIPVVTEKAVSGSSARKYTFYVDKQATKIDVKKAVKKLYGVDVMSVRIAWTMPKYRIGKGRRLMEKRSKRKKAIVTLYEGDSIDQNTFSKKAAKKTTAKKVEKAKTKKDTKATTNNPDKGGKKDTKK